MSLICTESLTRQFGPVTALDRLTVSVPTGVTGLVGANGAGKSTLIKILLGLQPATAGTAQVLGLDVRKNGREIRERVGYMPENDCLPPDVTATELVVHLARMSGLTATTARERTADVLRHCGLYEERYRSIGGYSTGMKQRVKLAQALVHDPALVFLDEPTNGLDPAGRDDMLSLIRRIGTDFGIAVLVTSHLLGELERICDHVVVIDGGRLLSSASTADATAVSQVLDIELTDRADELVHLLTQAGFTARRTVPELGGQSLALGGATLEVEVLDPAVYDMVRDGALQLKVGLVRMALRRRNLADLFRDGDGGSPAGDPARGAAGGSDVRSR